MIHKTLYALAPIAHVSICMLALVAYIAWGVTHEIFFGGRA